MHLSPLALFSALALVPCAVAQDGILWPAIDRATDALVVRTGPSTYEVYCDGFMTFAQGALDNSADVACGLGMTFGTIRKVDASQFEDPSEGEETDDLPPTFPFAPNVTTGVGFASDPRGAGLNWSGFHAVTARPVAPFHRGAFCFTFQNVLSYAQLVSVLTGAKAGVAKATPSGAVISDARLHIVDVRSVEPAQILYYSFDRRGDDLAINGAWPYAGAPTQGVMQSNSGSPWTQGAFGGGLRGGSADGTVRCTCDTGWRGDLYGDMTIAWWQRIQKQPDPQKPTFFVRGPGPFAVGASRAQNGQLRITGLAKQAPDLRFTTDVLKLGTSRWVAVAVVLDAASMKATLWVDGKLVETQPLPAIPDLRQLSGTLEIGAGTLANIADLDEFRLCAHAASAAEIAGWAKGPSPAATTYGAQGAALLHHSGQLPALGNSTYALHLRGKKSMATILALGPTQSPPWNVAGQLWYAQLAVLLPAVTDAQGALVLPLAIPSSPMFAGVRLHAQALQIAPGLQLYPSNAHSTSIR